MNLLRSSLQRIRPSLVLLQLLGNLLLLGLASLWLLIPDSHIWQLILSLVLGVLLIISVLEFYAYTLRQLRLPDRPLQVWHSALILCGWLLLFFIASLAISHWSIHIDQRAGFWNSRLSPSVRSVWTYERLQQWQQRAAVLTLWIVLPALLLPSLLETVSSGLSSTSLLRGVRVLGRWQHWVAAVVLCGAILFIAPWLLDWHPYDSVHGEIGSALLRLPLAFITTILLLMLLFSIDAELLARHDLRRHTGTQPLP